MTIDTSIISSQFSGAISLFERRPGVFQLEAPFFHEDGDMVDIYLEETKSGVRVSDRGMTLMRLSYSFDIDTENKRRIFNEIINTNGVQNDDGMLFVDSAQESLLPSVLQFAQTVAKVSNLSFLKREIISGLFFEQIAEFIERELVQFRPTKEVYPIEGRDDLEVPWELHVGSKNIFLFPIRNNAQARIASIACLEFNRENLPFSSCVVHDSFDNLSKKRHQQDYQRGG